MNRDEFKWRRGTIVRMPQSPTSKKGSALTSVGRGIDPEAWLELLERATRGLGEFARAFDAMLVQLVEKMKSSIPEKGIQGPMPDLPRAAIGSWHSTVQELQGYENRLHELIRENPIIATSASDLTGPSASGEFDQLAELRSQLFGSIPSSVWSDAVDGFGDPDLANV
jgi:hypothetical protein